MSKKNFVSLILGTVGGTVNTKVGEIAGEVGMTPAGWNGGIFNMIRGSLKRSSSPSPASVFSGLQI